MSFRFTPNGSYRAGTGSVRYGFYEIAEDTNYQTQRWVDSNSEYDFNYLNKDISTSVNQDVYMTSTVPGVSYILPTDTEPFDTGLGYSGHTLDHTMPPLEPLQCSPPMPAPAPQHYCKGCHTFKQHSEFCRASHTSRDDEPRAWKRCNTCYKRDRRRRQDRKLKPVISLSAQPTENLAMAGQLILPQSKAMINHYYGTPASTVGHSETLASEYGYKVMNCDLSSVNGHSADYPETYGFLTLPYSTSSVNYDHDTPASAEFCYARPAATTDPLESVCPRHRGSKIENEYQEVSMFDYAPGQNSEQREVCADDPFNMLMHGTQPHFKLDPLPQVAVEEANEVSGAMTEASESNPLQTATAKDRMDKGNKIDVKVELEVEELIKGPIKVEEAVQEQVQKAGEKLLEEVVKDQEPPRLPGREISPDCPTLAKLFAFVDLTAELLHCPRIEPSYSVENRAATIIQNYARAVRLVELHHKWQPQRGKRYHGARNDFFREVDEILEDGELEPWQPLAAWFRHYTEQVAASSVLLKSKRGVDIYGFHRRLIAKLADTARLEMGDARRNLKMLCREIGLLGCDDQIEQQLRQVQLAVMNDCRMHGVLSEKDIHNTDAF